MNNLSEDILMRYLTGECSDEDFARVNAWSKNQTIMPADFSEWKRYIIWADTTAFRIRKKLPGQKHDYTRNWLRKMHIAAK